MCTDLSRVALQVWFDLHPGPSLTQPTCLLKIGSWPAVAEVGLGAKQLAETSSG